MKIPRLAAMLAIAGVTLFGGQKPAIQKATVTVCMDADKTVLMGVRPLASKMFARIDIAIDWRERDACPSGTGAIQVRLSHGVPVVPHSDALAVAQPYQGTIVVFLDRVQELSGSGVPSLMAHVLVHEITHVLEGIDRHSATGIMKAHWSNKDYIEMGRNPLAFAPEDVNLIDIALKIPHTSPGEASAQTVAGQ